MFPKPCHICSRLTTLGNYCGIHQRQREVKETQRQADRRRGRTLYASKEYKEQARAIKATATHCHLCGQAFTNREEITADHLRPGDPTSPLAPAHRSCNSSRGNKPLTK